MVAVCAGLALAAPRPRVAAAPLTEAQARQIGTEAYVYGIPLLAFIRQQRTQTSVTVPNALSDAPLNRLGNQLNFASVAHQVIVAPNVDTLYSMAHLDLGAGPLVLHVPAVPDHHYYVFEFIDPFTNVFHYVGTRTTGDGAGNYAIVGPAFHGRLPAGLHRITSAYANVWIAGRTLVYGARGLAAAHRIQDGYRLLALADFERFGLGYRWPRPRRVITTHTVATIPTGLAFLDALGTALADNPPPERDARILGQLASAGIGAGRHPSAEHLPAATIAGLEAGVAAGPAQVLADRTDVVVRSVIKHHGWYVAPSNIGNFGTDYALRSVVAVFGIAANIPVEAMYPVGSVDSAGALLNGADRYVIHITKGDFPPVRFYWSFTAYDHSLYLVPNAVHRYAISQFTPGVKDNADGSLDIYLQSTPPAGHASNWLPTPPAGQFEVILRMYGPKRPALDGTYSYPPIVRQS
jgi:hypothetical protein